MSSQHDDGRRLSDAMWARMAPLIPLSKPLPLSCYRPRIPDRVAMDAILLLLRTGMQWGSLDATGLCLHSSAHRRCREWADAGVRGAREDRLGLAGAGWDDDQSPVGRGKKSARTRPTAAKGAPCAACSLMATVCR